MTFKQRLQRWKTLFSRKPIWQGNKDFTIVPAFACGGVQYYEIPGVFNMPYSRALAAKDVLMEVDSRVTREYLELHTKKVKSILSDPKSINILELSRLYNELDQRMKWIISPEALYKLAAVVYFDANEDPKTFNWDYAHKKIELWKKSKVDDFFLQEPIRRYIPYSELLEKDVWKSEKDLLDYVTSAIKMEKLQTEALLS